MKVLKNYLQSLSPNQLYRIMLDLGIVALIDSSVSEKIADILEFALTEGVNEYDLVDYYKENLDLL